MGFDRTSKFYVGDLSEDLYTISDIYDIDQVLSAYNIPQNKRGYCTLFARNEYGSIVELWGCEDREPTSNSEVHDLGSYIDDFNEGERETDASHVEDYEDSQLSYTTPYDVDD